MKKKSMLVVAIILMSIGFAAVSTTLIINGNAKVNENTDDYSVIFTAATLDGIDVYDEVTDDTKKTITFKSKDLKKLNDTSVLTYEVTNNSANYDAEVRVICVPKDGTTAKYTSIKNELEGNATVVKANETLNGTLTVTLDKQSIEETTEEYTCSLEFNAVERTELGVSYDGPTEWTFDYTGDEQTFEVPVNGTYKLETWGAEGGKTVNISGGYGGYSQGIIYLEKNNKFYINIGGQGLGELTWVNKEGGYNGGGSASFNSATNSYNASGGGATHIALESGLLYAFNNNIDDVLIVSGGGAGGGNNDHNYKIVSGSGGGYIGGNSGSYIAASSGKPYQGFGGTQTNGGKRIYNSVNESSNKNNPNFGTFGQGGGGTLAWAGGGGGFYGGTVAGYTAGGGSGYIGNSLLSEKSMYCYNCTESSEESTKTISTTCTSETPTENCSKQGNGYARITLIK